MGCTCPTIDNHYGRGLDDSGCFFWHDEKCPVHKPQSKELENSMRAFCLRSTRGEYIRDYVVGVGILLVAAAVIGAIVLLIA